MDWRLFVEVITDAEVWKNVARGVFTPWYSFFLGTLVGAEAAFLAVLALTDRM